MMNKSLRAARGESSRKLEYGFQRGEVTPKKRAAVSGGFLKLITGRRQTEWTGATRCPNEDIVSH
ncbi:MAG: hypothetical protein ACRD5Z_21290, partial [Bryobacteraceae bacterium]